MTTATLVILAMTLAPHVQRPKQAPPPQTAPSRVAQADAAPKAITLIGCVVAAVDREDTLQLVPAEPDPGRPVGTTGPSPAWTVPAYLLLGGMVRFSEHGNKTVEITGVLDPVVETAEHPKKTGETVTRAAPAVIVPARLQVQSAKVTASECKPKTSSR